MNQHKVSTVNLGAATKAIVYPDNIVVAVDSLACEVTGLYMPDAKGDFNPSLRHLDMSVAMDGCYD